MIELDYTRTNQNEKKNLFRHNENLNNKQNKLNYQLANTSI